MTTVADLRVRFSADIGNAISGIRTVDDSIRKLQSSANSALGGINFGQMFNVAGGNLIADGIRGITSTFVDLGGQALTSYADFERLGVSLQTMAAAEMVNTGAASDMASALAMSGDKAQELLGWIQKLAIESPFQQADVADAHRTIAAYGFATDEAQRLTQAMIDFAAGSGNSGAMMSRIALALGQIQARGKVSAQELNQLSEAGINARSILANAFHVSTAEITQMIERGLVPADRAVEALTVSLERDFGGAAKRQASTFSGMISTLSDLKSVGLREFFAGTFQATQPLLERFVNTLANPETLAGIRGLGDTIGQSLAGGLAIVEQRLDRAVASFNLLSGQGDTVGGLLAGLGSFTGGDVTINTAAKITDVTWGNWTHSYNALANVLDVDWTSSLGDGGMGFTYDAEAGITGVTWNSEGLTYVYDATAGITFVDFAQGAFTGTYMADASVTDVLWGFWTHSYNATAGISESGVLWGAWTHSYDANAQVSETNILWGTWTYTYDAQARITNFEFNGELLGQRLSALSMNLGQGLADAADSLGKSLNAPPWVQSLINWKPSDTGPSWLEQLTVKLAPGVLSMLSSLVIKAPSIGEMRPLLTMSAPTLAADFWPAMPSFSWPSLPSWSWPELPALAFADLPSFSWPSLPTFAWPTLPAVAFAELPVWTWPALPLFQWPTLPSWSWPAMPSFSWPSLPSWSWPDYNPFKWPSFPSFRWPAIPMPDWVNALINWRPTLPSWLGGGGSDAPVGNNASGTSAWRGGLTWVGEQGPELGRLGNQLTLLGGNGPRLMNLPRGMEIYSHPRTMQMLQPSAATIQPVAAIQPSVAAGGASGSGATTTTIINLEPHFHVASQIDIHQAAYQVADIIQKRSRR